MRLTVVSKLRRKIILVAAFLNYSEFNKENHKEKKLNLERIDTASGCIISVFFVLSVISIPLKRNICFVGENYSTAEILILPLTPSVSSFQIPTSCNSRPSECTEGDAPTAPHALLVC